MGERIFDLAVAGAGVMGMACALAAARLGKRVVVFDPAGAGIKASWAAAGILVTRDARVFASPFREFYVRSIHAYPAWLETLANLSGKELALIRGGDYQIYDLDNAQGRSGWEARLYQLQREHARHYHVSDSLPPFLKGFFSLENAKVLHFPDEAYIQNRELLDHLRVALEKSGVTLVAGKPLSAPEFRAGSAGRGNWVFRLPEVEVEVEARQFLICAGAWSGHVLEALGISSPLIPVKGQMLRIPKFYAGSSMVHCNEDFYMIPRGESLVVGATTEPGRWDEGFDEVGKAFLEERLRRYLPDVAHGSLEQWSGIRPRTRDRLPLMGWVDPRRELAICAGHYKSGISMAPLASECISKLLNKEKPPLDLAPFDPWRPKGLSRLAGSRNG